MKNLPYLALVIAIAGCGGGGSSVPADSPESVESRKSTVKAASASTPAFTAITVIGNSLTYYPPSAVIGWAGDWGMASTSREKDFAHLTASALGKSLQVFNISGLESDQATYVPHIPDVTGLINGSTAVVIELGDNVKLGTEPAFLAAYEKLLDATKPGAALVCLSMWWERPVLDVKIKAACEAHGGAYVYIGDIYPTRKDAPGNYTDAGVAGHPHDWSMQVISDRVVQALK